MDGISVKGMQENLKSLGPYSTLLIVLGWFIAAGMYFTMGTFFTAILALIIFTVLCPIGMFIANKIRTMVQPDLVLTSGVGELVKTRIYFAIGPQIIAIVIVLILSASVLHMKSSLNAEETYSQTVGALKNADKLSVLTNEQVLTLREYETKVEEIQNQPYKELEKTEEYKARVKKEIEVLSSMLTAAGLKNNGIYIIDELYIDPEYLANGGLIYDVDKETIHFEAINHGNGLKNFPFLTLSELVDVQFAGTIIKACSDEVRERKPHHRNFTVPMARDTAKKLKDAFGTLNFDWQNAKMSDYMTVVFFARLSLSPKVKLTIVRANFQPKK